MAGVDAGTVYSSIRIRLTQLDQDLKGVYARLDKLENKLEKSTDPKKVQKNFNVMSLAGTAAFVAIGNEIRKSIVQFADFEQSLANVASVSGGTAKELSRLEDAARAAGETTRFTATEAANSLYYLASAGLDASESVAALDGVLQLAGATQSDLATTAASLTATISQYGLDAADATKVSNIFASAIGNSQATMEKLTNSLRYAGPVAGAFGISLEETTGALQLLYNAGFQGEQAGTILRNVFSDLANASGPVIERLEEMGVRFEDVNPQTNTFSDSIRALTDANITASDALAIFGDRAGPGLITLLQAGGDEIDAMTGAVTDTTAAAEMYETQNDTLAGSMDRLKSESESLRIGVGDGLNPAFRALVDLATSIIGLVNKIPDPLKAMGATMAAAVLGVNGLSAALAALGVSLNIALGPVAIVAGAVAALGVGIVALNNKIKEHRAADLAEQYGELAKNLEISTQEAEALDDALRLGGMDNITTAKEQVDALSNNLGIAKDKIVEIGLASEYVSDTYKAQLQTLKDQIEEEKRIEEKARDRLIVEKELLETKRRGREEDQGEIVRLTADQKAVQAVKQEIEEQIKVIELQKLLYKEMEKEFDAVSAKSAAVEKGLNDLRKNGFHPLGGGIQYIISLFKDYIKSDITDTTDNATESLGRFLERQKDVSDQMVENNELRTMTDREFMEALRERREALKAQQDEEAAQQEKISDAIDTYKKKLFELNATEAEALAAQEKAALATADQMEGTKDQIESVKDAILEYYQAVRETEKQTEVFGGKTQEELDEIVENLEDVTNAVFTLFDAFTSGDATAILDAIAAAAAEAGSAIGGTTGAALGAIGGVVAVISTIKKLFDEAERRAEEYNNTVIDLNDETTRQLLKNRKKTLDYEYDVQKEMLDLELYRIQTVLDAEKDAAEKTKDAKITAAREAISKELELLLVQMGVITATRTQAYDQMYEDIIQKAEDAGVKLTDDELNQISTILNAQLDAEEAATAAEQKAAAEEEKIRTRQEALEKEYKTALAKWDYDKAVADKAAAIAATEINRNKAISELSWWQINVDHLDREINSLYSNLQSSIQASPLPPIPSFQTGGIVPGARFTGDNIAVQANSGEMILTREQQKQLFNIANGATAAPGMQNNMTFVFELNGRQIAENTVGWIDNGKVRFKVLAR